MNITESIDLLWQQIRQTGWLQWLAVSLAVAEVLFARVNNILLYPAGLAATALSVYILFNAKLYAESLLNVYYVAMSIYGWWYWVKKKNKPPVQITSATRRDWLIVAAMTLTGFLLLTFLLKKFTDSTVPVADAWVTATAWTGMWLLAKRKTENWILLNISNAFAVPLLLHKDLPLYALLTIFLFGVAVNGYFRWRKEERMNRLPTSQPYV